MEKHLTFEQIEAVLTARRCDAAFLHAVSAVNRHISHCEECRRLYDAMYALLSAAEERPLTAAEARQLALVRENWEQALQQRTEAARRGEDLLAERRGAELLAQRRREEEERIRQAEARRRELEACAAPPPSPRMRTAPQEKPAARVLAWFRIVLQDGGILLREAALDGAPGVFDFCHPVPLGARGAAAVPDRRALVDDEDGLNRLCAEADGSLRLTLDREQYPAGPLQIRLVNGNGQVLESLPAQDNGEALCAHFAAPGEGEYAVQVVAAAPKRDL